MAEIGEPVRTEPLQVPAPERNPKREESPKPQEVPVAA